jgi:hypothetical protein
VCTRIYTEETENVPSTHSFFQCAIILKPSIKLGICLHKGATLLHKDNPIDQDKPVQSSGAVITVGRIIMQRFIHATPSIAQS